MATRTPKPPPRAATGCTASPLTGAGRHFSPGEAATPTGAALVDLRALQSRARDPEGRHTAATPGGSAGKELRDVLALQSELAQEVTREIRVALTPEEERRLSRTRPIDPEVHFAFLRGQYHASKGSPADLHTALRQYHGGGGGGHPRRRARTGGPGLDAPDTPRSL
jgi:hypothetical protein